MASNGDPLNVASFRYPFFLAPPIVRSTLEEAKVGGHDVNESSQSQFTSDGRSSNVRLRQVCLKVKTLNTRTIEEVVGLRHVHESLQAHLFGSVKGRLHDLPLCTFLTAAGGVELNFHTRECVLEAKLSR